MAKLSLGIDLACQADHRASLADEQGRYVWSGRSFRTTVNDLDSLIEDVPIDELTVVVEPTRNAWVPVAAYFMARGAAVVLLPPEQAADLRRYYSKHAKNDRLDSRLLAKLPLLHPEGLRTLGDDELGPANPLKRAVRRRARLVDARTRSYHRLDALLEIFGPAYGEAFGAGEYSKAAIKVLARYADPRDLLRLGRARLTAMVKKASRGMFREAKAEQLLAAARESIELWRGGGLDMAELALDIASEARMVSVLSGEIEEHETRIEGLYAEADPEGIVASAPGPGPVLAAGILGRLGDPSRFGSLAGVRAFSGMVPATDQSGLAEGGGSLTKAGDPGLRRDLYLAADQARLVDPQLAARYHRLMVERGMHHTSALCHVATVLLTRIAACWRGGQRYVLRDVDGREISEAEGRAIVRDRYRIPEEVRAARRRTGKAKHMKGGTRRRSKESTETAPASDASRRDPTGASPGVDVR